ncbi:MAG TPA: VIT1/CCC1 family protein [Steroidobacteraceae bacterium]|jgi:VIT1/CCC1 family predicted Fe2+/Mn2+ transporter|nr:VIT1/CCC1 family protein [Steroidobacteraceae bacterium]
MSRSGEPARWLRNWREELDSAALYGALAHIERDRRQRDVYEELASAERRHAAFWEQRLRTAGEVVPPFRCGLRTRLLIHLARRLGVGFIVPSVIAREMRDRDAYDRQEDARAAGLAHDELGHAAALRRRRVGGLGNNLRAAVLGANDGLASNFCLMMGVAGGGGSTTTILLTGIAGLVSGSCSMALGEWLSVTNARELTLSQADRAPGATGVEDQDPEASSANDAANAAMFSALLFSLGALLPLLPFGVLPVAVRIRGTIVISIIALFGIGLATSLFNARSPWFSGLRQVVIGAAAATVTYLVGWMFGALAGIH